VIANLPKTKTPAKTMQGVTVDPSAIVPKDTDYYRYMGSLTTPPCSEGVNWFIAADPEEASKAQIEAIAKAVGMNSRPAQRINNRLVIEP
jgi:carbonic anhydrase